MLLLAFPVNTISQNSYIPVVSANNHSAWFENLKENEPGLSMRFVNDLNKFTNLLDKKSHRYKDRLDFLRYVYFKVHRKYLGRYQSPATFRELMENKKYDCLTGTALYAIVFEKLGVSPDIVETTYHVYLTLNVDGSMVLIESTSPLGGFITDGELINQALQQYQQDSGGENWSYQDYYQPAQTVNNKITLRELAGLQYFNQAVADYNDKKLSSALKQLATALSYYPSDRLKEMMGVMLNTLSQETDIDPDLKQEYLSRYGHLRYSLITAHQQK